MPSTRLASRDLALIAVFAALIAALALPGAFFVPASSVPITAQTLGVMLAGCILGARRAALSVLTFLVLVAVGLPVLASGASGLGVFASPRAGFLIGWIPGAWLIGRLVELWPHRLVLGWGVIANIAGGIVVIYALGIPVMAARAGLSLTQAITASWVFVPGDLVKAVLAAVIAAAVHRGYPLLPTRDNRPEPSGLPAEEASR